MVHNHLPPRIESLSFSVKAIPSKVVVVMMVILLCFFFEGRVSLSSTFCHSDEELAGSEWMVSGRVGSLLAPSGLLFFFRGRISLSSTLCQADEELARSV